MKVPFAIVIISVAILSCSKEELDGFDRNIQVAEFYGLHPVTGDTCCAFYMPSGFTPNGDGINDMYTVYGTGFDYDNYTMRIFSHEGNMIYYVNDIYNSWDGTLQGHSNIESTQSYVAKVDIADTLGQEYHFEYSVLLMK